jgi:glyoxylase-like metal-dependent hydrolase (beta-lactamase superfamily II)
MAYTRSAVAPHDLAFTETPSVKRASGPGILRRLYATITAARLRHAEREIARYLYGNGGKFTDEAEREIERRFLANDRRW